MATEKCYRCGKQLDGYCRLLCPGCRQWCEEKEAEQDAYDTVAAIWELKPTGPCLHSMQDHYIEAGMLRCSECEEAAKQEAPGDGKVMAANIGQHPESIAMVGGRLTLTEPDGRVIVLDSVVIKQWAIELQHPVSPLGGWKHYGLPSALSEITLTCEFVAGSLEVVDGASAVEQKAAVKKAVDNAARHVLNPSRKFRKE